MATYVLNESKMFSDIADGIAIIINSETGIYYGMNGFGTNIFENLVNGASTEALAAALKGLPGAPEDMENRLNAFVDKLVRYEIVVEGDAAGGAVNLDDAAAAPDDFTPDVEEFDDAQEMLLADPIHEVKSTDGWAPSKDALDTDEDAVQEKKGKMHN